MKTSDMWLASAAMSYGLNLVRINKEDPRRLEFEFSGDLQNVHWLESGEVKTQEKADWEWLNMRFLDRSLLYPGNYPDSVRRVKQEIFQNDKKPRQ